MKKYSVCQVVGEGEGEGDMPVLRTNCDRQGSAYRPVYPFHDHIIHRSIRSELCVSRDASCVLLPRGGLMM